MRVFITGGTGFVGRSLVQRLLDLGWEVTLITRTAETIRALHPGVSVVEGNPGKPGAWQESVPKHDVVINLAGKSIFTLWTAKTRREIMDSRILITRNLVEALQSAPQGTLLISTSAVGFYGSGEDDAEYDESSPAGEGFLAEVCKRWEAEARLAERFGVRLATCRFGIVMGKNGGALEQMMPAFRYGLGSPLGSGRQWFSWVHMEDLVGIIVFLIEKRDIFGAVNAVAPHPVRNRELTEVLAKAFGRRVILPAVPGFLIRSLLGEFGSVLVEGQRAIPRRLLDAGYRFRFSTLEDALADLIGKRV